MSRFIRLCRYHILPLDQTFHPLPSLGATPITGTWICIHSVKVTTPPRFQHSSRKTFTPDTSTVSVHIMLYRTQQHSLPLLPSFPFPNLHTDADRESLHVMFNFLSHNLLMIQGKENNHTAQSSTTWGCKAKAKKKEPEQNRTAGDCAVWCCVIILLAPYHPCTVARTRTTRKKREKTNQVKVKPPTKKKEKDRRKM